MDSYILKLIEENKKLKEQLRKQKTFKRGDIVYVQMTSRNIEKCSIEAYSRPYLIVSNDVGNYHSDIVLGVPLTSKLKKLTQPTHYRISYHDSVVLCEQIKTLSQENINTDVNYHLSDDEMKEVEKCLKISLGMEE